MKKLLSWVVVLLIALSFVAFAETEHDLADMSYAELTDLGHELLNELVSRPEWQSGSTTMNASTSLSVEAGAETSPLILSEGASLLRIRNYVGRNLSTCGYTSYNNELRDKYADSSLMLVCIADDGSFIDPSDTSCLATYTVLAQTPAADTLFEMHTDDSGKATHMGYDEIILLVSASETEASVTEMTSVRPSLNKSIYYVRNYIGRNMASVGSTAYDGKRYDSYGGNGRVELSIVDSDGKAIDPGSESELKYYSIVEQSVEPDTELRFTYKEDNSGREKLFDQSVKSIRITVEMSGVGKEEKMAKTLEEEALRTSGAMFDLYKGTYEVGKDIQIGNYTLSLLTDSCTVYYYADKASLDADEGDWDFIYGDGDTSLITLRDGMFVKINNGAAVALRTDLKTGDNEYELFKGVFRVGENMDLEPGNYTLSQISDSCNVYFYLDKAALDADDGDWDFLYGDGDTSLITLQDGMFVKINNGAASAVRTDVNCGNNEYELFKGLFKVGTDIVAGNYDISLLSESCNLYIYQNEEALNNDEGEWAFLYGTGDTKHYNLCDDMYLKVSNGAVKAARK